MANSLRPDAVISIHADGGPASGRGFHVLYSSPPLNDVQAGPSVRLATIMKDQLQASGLVPSTYIGCADSQARSQARARFAARAMHAIEIPGDHFRRP